MPDSRRRRHGGVWSAVGHANYILDNLLAEKKAVPMIVVMPSGWTPSGGQVMTSDATKDPFNDELLKDIIPFVGELSHHGRSGQPRALGPVDGRHSDVEHRSPQPRHVQIPGRHEAPGWISAVIQAIGEKPERQAPGESASGARDKNHGQRASPSAKST